jgi:hypothetical protein
VGTEKRRHPRVKVRKSAACYIDGSRVDVESENLSLGGMFLATPAARPAEGTDVAIVFADRADSANPTFLFGRVMHHRDEPVRGVGIRWEKAVTVGGLPDLVAFLTNTLGIARAEVEARAVPRSSGRKWVYPFPATDDPADAPHDDVDAPPPPPSAATPAPDGAPDEPKAPSPGSITGLIARRAIQSSAAIDATLSWRDAKLTVRILRIGLAGMFVQTPFMPLASDAQVSVRFVATAGGIPQVFECLCRLNGVEPDVPGIELSIEDVDERGSEGAFVAFLKRLQFRTLAGS